MGSLRFESIGYPYTWYGFEASDPGLAVDADELVGASL